MTRLGRLLGLIVALGGFAAAHVVAQAGQAQQLPTLTAPTLTTPTLTTPTLTTPTVSVPTVPAPPPAPVPTVTTPTVPVPTVPTPPQPAPVPAPVPAPAPSPAPVPSPPAVSAPALTGSGAAVPAQAKTQTGAAGGGSGANAPAPPIGLAPAPTAPSGSGASVAPASGRAGSTSRARATARPQALRARRFTVKGRVGVRLSFVLPRSGRIFLVVRGPAPSCRVAGVIPVRGRKGANVVAFAGRVNGRRLGPGVYLISLSSTKRPTPGAPTEYVRVVSPRRSVPLPDSAPKPSCRESLLLAYPGTARILLAEEKRPVASLAGLAATPLPSTSGAAAGRSDGSGADEDGLSGVLPDVGPLGGDATDGGFEAFAAIAALAVVGALLLAMLALVTRFLRGNWNP